MAKAAIVGHTVTLKIKYHDFDVTTRQTTAASVIHDQAELLEVADLLLQHAPEPPNRAVRLLGVSVSKLHSIHDGPLPEQLALNFTRAHQ